MQRPPHLTISPSESTVDDPRADSGAWLARTEELTVPPARLRPQVSIARLGSIAAAATAVVVLGLVGSGGGRDESGTGALSSARVPASADGAASFTGAAPPARGERGPVEIVILLPARGDVVLGNVVAVAGTVAVAGPPRGIARPAEVHITISDARAVLGATTLPVVDGRFVGWVVVLAPEGAVIVELRAWDASRADPEVSSHEFVLRADSVDGG